jgi:hypothetical protein
MEKDDWLVVIVRMAANSNKPLSWYHCTLVCDGTVTLNNYLPSRIITIISIIINYEELAGRAVIALGVRSRKLSTGLNGQS